MKKCPFCEKEDYTEKYFCEACGSYMGSDHPEGLPPSPSAAIKAQRQMSPSATPPERKPRKTRKQPEYVWLRNGRLMKKSTYNWLQKKDEAVGRFFLVFLGVSIFLGLIQSCN